MAQGYSCEHNKCFVVHEGWECPLCETEKEIEDLKEELAYAQITEGGK